VFKIEVCYNGRWHHFESADDLLTAYRVRRDVRNSLKLPAKVTCAGIEVTV
jgi:hypothetical protein